MAAPRCPARRRATAWEKLLSRLKTLLAALCIAPALAFVQTTAAPLEGRLKKIHDTKTIKVAYRTDALPFSFEA